MTEPLAPIVSDIELRDSGVPGTSHDLRAVVAVPAGAGPWPAVVLVHEAFGLTDVMRRQVIRVAQAGYIAIMPDLFSDGGARRCLIRTFRAIAAREGRAFDDVEAARRAVVGRDDCTGRVGLLGFCMGGGFALAAASGRHFDVVSANYGQPPSDLDDALANACPIVGSYGGRDRSMRGAPAKLEAALTTAGVPHDIKEYPTAGHSFLNDADTGPRALRPITRRILGAGPDPVAAADAWKRIERFFGEYLAG
jgi:carboxymethylenebutenolidase